MDMQDIRGIEGGVTAAGGFMAAAAAAGIKYQGRDDMAMIFSSRPCVAAGTFTSNVVKAAPVVWDRDIVRFSDRKVQAVVVNSGIANACTGEEGMAVCRKTAAAAAEALSIPAESVLLGSTGVIGMQIPTDRICGGVQTLAGRLSASTEAGAAAAGAIMTTDTIRKEAACCFDADDGTGHPVKVSVGGMSKGSGMIHPNMCTMLAYITTDAAIDKAVLQQMVSEIVSDSFNMISVDGDTSTNDTLLVLANGAAGNLKITEADSPAGVKFREALTFVCTKLAMMMAGDGEGATKLIEAKVTGADTKEHARVLARSVICSNLTKAAIFGKDANWGRVLCALGYAGVDFDPENVDLYFAEGDPQKKNGALEPPGTAAPVTTRRRLLIFTHGAAADYSEEEATQILSSPVVDLIANMHMGEAEATAWGCDLTYDYVKINADYRS